MFVIIVIYAYFIDISQGSVVTHLSGFLQVREKWKMSRNLCCQGKSGNCQEKYYFWKVREKSGKMILDHADCR